MKWLERTQLLIQQEGIEKLQKAHVLIVGLGGVGSFAAEFMARAGVGTLTIVDGDVFDITNINRQLPALHSTVGKSKATILAERLLDINPSIKLHVREEFLTPETAFEIVTPAFDYVIDCIDSLLPKINLIVAARRKKVKIISSMGAGGKLDISKIKVADISKTKQCVLARYVKKQLKARNINRGVKVVYSEEMQLAESLQMVEGNFYKKSYYGTISYMPAAFGMFAAATVVNFLIKNP